MKVTEGTSRKSCLPGRTHWLDCFIRLLFLCCPSDCSLTQCLGCYNYVVAIYERANLRIQVHPLQMAGQRNGTILDPLASFSCHGCPSLPTSRLTVLLGTVASCAINSLLVQLLLTPFLRNSHTCA